LVGQLGRWELRTEKTYCTHGLVLRYEGVGGGFSVGGKWEKFFVGDGAF